MGYQAHSYFCQCRHASCSADMTRSMSNVHGRMPLRRSSWHPSSQTVSTGHMNFDGDIGQVRHCQRPQHKHESEAVVRNAVHGQQGQVCASGHQSPVLLTQKPACICTCQRACSQPRGLAQLSFPKRTIRKFLLRHGAS